MRVALVNPPWSFRGSIYFGCREPHLPLELGWTRDLLEAEGHRVLLVDGHLFGLGHADIRAELLAFRPDLTVVTTAPTYLFWRCAPPELRVPLALLRDARRGRRPARLAVGPHGSTTPRAALRQARPSTAWSWASARRWWPRSPAARGKGCRAWPTARRTGRCGSTAGPQAAAFADRAPLRLAGGVGARGTTTTTTASTRRPRVRAPRSRPRAAAPTAAPSAPRRTSATATAAARRPRSWPRSGRLQAQGVEYVYFIDEIFLPNRPLLEGLVGRRAEVRRPDPHRPVEARDARAARARGLRLDRGRRREPDARGPGRAGEELQARRPRSWPSAWSWPSATSPSSRPTCSRCRRTTRAWWAPGATGCARRACGPTTPSRSSPTRARPTTGSSGACRTTRPGSARVDHYLATFRDFSELQEARALPLRELEAVA